MQVVLVRAHVEAVRVCADERLVTEAGARGVSAARGVGGVEEEHAPGLGWVIRIANGHVLLGMGTKGLGYRIEVDLQRGQKPALRIGIEVALGIADEVAEHRRAAANDGRLRQQELVERGGRRECRTGLAEDAKSIVDGLHDKVATNAEPLVGRLQAEVSHGVGAGTGMPLVLVIDAGKTAEVRQLTSCQCVSSRPRDATRGHMVQVRVLGRVTVRLDGRRCLIGQAVRGRAGAPGGEVRLSRICQVSGSSRTSRGGKATDARCKCG